MESVSIIMPVYNAEKYLREAIDSVLRQTYPDFRLFLINDRSTDRSKEICLEYARKDDRIVFLENNTESHGPGPTRNIGLDHATGDYIYFMDADDWIEDRLLECAVNRMRETGADIVQFGVFYERNGEIVGKNCWNGKSILNKEDINDHFLRESPMNLWMHLFRLETVQSIRFEDILNGEDVCYMMDAFYKARKIAFTSEVSYHYRILEGSTCHRWVDSTIECLEVQWNHQHRFIRSLPEPKDPLLFVTTAYGTYMWAIYQLSAVFCPLSFREKKRRLSKLSKIIGFEKYRKRYPLETEHGLARVKYALVKYHLEGLILFLGPLYYRVIK